MESLVVVGGGVLPLPCVGGVETAAQFEEGSELLVERHTAEPR